MEATEISTASLRRAPSPRPWISSPVQALTISIAVTLVAKLPRISSGLAVRSRASTLNGTFDMTDQSRDGSLDRTRCHPIRFLNGPDNYDTRLLSLESPTPRARTYADC